MDDMKNIIRKLFNQNGFWLAILSALFFSLNVPVSKFLLKTISPYWLASLLYFGAGFGMLLFRFFGKRIANSKIEIRHQIRWFALMISLDILAPILFLIGVKTTDGVVVGLLSNTELIFTLFVALIVFKEKLNPRLWFSLSLIFMGVFLSNIPDGEFQFQLGQLWILFAMALWGLENNVSRKLSLGNPVNLVMIKGLATGIGTMIISVFLLETMPSTVDIIIALFAGFVIYGGSLIFYVFSQRTLGAARVQMIQSFAPLTGGILAYLFFNELVGIYTWIGYLLVMIALSMIGLDLMKKDSKSK
jgi:drug/metabolite transporter (DMT)-like permease